MLIKLLTEGSWWTTCPSDKRWEESGRAEVGGFVMPRGCRDFLDAKKRELGMEPPDDCAWHYMKD